MTFTHGDPAIDHDFMGIMNDAVNDGFGYRRIWFGADPFIPALWFKLGAEDNWAFDGSGFNDLQQFSGLVAAQRAQQKFIQDQEIDFLITFDDLLIGTFTVSDRKFVE